MMSMYSWMYSLLFVTWSCLPIAFFAGAPEHRLSLAEERAHGSLVTFGLERDRFECERQVVEAGDPLFEIFVDETLVESHGDLRTGRQLAGHLHHGLFEFVGGHDVVDEPEVVGFGGGEQITGHEI